MGLIRRIYGGGAIRRIYGVSYVWNAYYTYAGCIRHTAYVVAAARANGCAGGGGGVDLDLNAGSRYVWVYFDR